MKKRGLVIIFLSEALRFEYTAGGASALDGVDISIEKGAFAAVVGHNGSGKSTLARHLNALLVPTGGTLWVKGLDTRDPDNAWTVRRTAGMVFQNPDNQLVAAIVEEDVAFGPENLGVPSAEIRARVDEALADVRMSDYAGAEPHRLSGGQKQRVAIAGILAMRPDCIVLDEPTAMLDPAGRREVLDTVLRLNREHGITVILITHFMDEAARAERVFVMDSGRVVMDGPPREVFSHTEEMTKLGLGVPPAAALASELRGRGVPMPSDILTAEEFIERWESLCHA
jgi:energy-coupling factor transport system ATP-binding protein